MTTGAMIFGMLPVAIGHGDGGEVRAPMGIVVIGGLITSTVLTLVVVPVLYSLLEGGRMRVVAPVLARHRDPSHHGSDGELAMMRPTRRERAAEHTREDILVAAARVFARKGYAAAGVQEIAAEAGFAAASLYSYFKGKRAIWDALRGQGHRGVRRALGQAAAGRAVARTAPRVRAA
jgi:hypothetical protein